MTPAISTQTHRGLGWLVSQLDALTGPLDARVAHQLLTQANLTAEEVAPYVESPAASYSRRCVARREHYELLVLTWYPSQGSVAHDHSGSLCGLKVVRGKLTEQLFKPGPDGQVRKTIATPLREGGITIDPGVVIHALGNDADCEDVLVTVHIYSPPLPEIRRYAVTQDPPASIFVRRPAPNARTIVIVGGGFTGAMTLVNLLRFGNDTKVPLHIAMIDRQSAIGEGTAYRTNDGRHLLNVPAARMSAWPDQPDDFLDFARSRDASIQPYDFVPRKIYGQYVRQILFRLAEKAGDHLSIELVRDEAIRLSQSASSTWTVATSAGRQIDGDVAILTLGHRPPDDPFAGRWSGPRNRFVADPWAALVLSQIGPDEPVMLLGSGLTAVDAILTLNRPNRKAPIIVVSRRGLLPLPHSNQPTPAADLSKLAAKWLDPASMLTIHRLVKDLRQQISTARDDGTDWRQVIDGLRPWIPRIWDRLNIAERSRFLSRIRPFWEIHRHRMPPSVFQIVDGLRRNHTLQLVSGNLNSASADADGVTLGVAPRNGSARKTVHVNWVINCTGPGVQGRRSTHPVLRTLIESGALCDDELGLGLLTDSIGQAIDVSGKTLNTLLIAGTLRKATLWESTAIPELRQQAQSVAQAALTALLSKH